MVVVPARRGPDSRRDARFGHCARVLVLGCPGVLSNGIEGR